MLLSVKLHREYYGHKATAEGLFGARAELEQAAEFIRQKTARDMPRSRIPPPPRFRYGRKGWMARQIRRIAQRIGERATRSSDTPP
jgi:hypothetical protein